MDSLLVSDLLFLDQLLFKTHFLVDNLLLDWGFNTFQGYIVINSFLVLLINKLRLKVRNFELKCDIFILDQIQLSLNLINIILSRYFALKRTYLRSFTKLKLQGINLFPT